MMEEHDAMPTYDYECGQCRKKFELRQGFHDDSRASCPECDGEARRLFTPVPVIFKGSGFYVTDSRAPEPKESGDGDGKARTESKEAVAATSED